MAKRPAFVVAGNHVAHLVDVIIIEFPWIPGLATSQKQKCVEAMHFAIARSRNLRTLEVSSKSTQPLGKKISAFNLGFIHPKTQSFISVESAFQGSKVFDGGGPFPYLYTKDARQAKQHFRDKDLGQLVRFDFYGQIWPLTPPTLFYDWLYLKSLARNRAIANKVCEYDCFTDIEFNPKRSINCQAYSAALFVSLFRRGILDIVMKDRESYIHRMKDEANWIMNTEYLKYHDIGQGLLSEQNGQPDCQ